MYVAILWYPRKDIIILTDVLRDRSSDARPVCTTASKLWQVAASVNKKDVLGLRSPDRAQEKSLVDADT